MKKIVVVEDDKMLQEELVHLLQKNNYETIAITDFSEDVVKQVQVHHPDLVLLDINLPYQTGFEICRQLAQDNRFGILILTSRAKLKDELHALQLGADDYITKPFQPSKLLARIEAILRRFANHPQLLQGEDFQLDPQTYTLYASEQAIVLKDNEGKILQILLEEAPNLVTKERLNFLLWQTDQYIDENTLQVNMTRLRKNMRQVGLQDRIETVRGKGYRLKELNEDMP